MTEKNKGNGGLSRRNLLKLLREGALALAAGYILQGCGGSGGSSGGGAPAPAPSPSPSPTQTITVGAATRNQGSPQTDSFWSSSLGVLYTQVTVQSQVLGNPQSNVSLEYRNFQALEADKATVNVGTNITWIEIGSTGPNNSATFVAA